MTPQQLFNKVAKHLLKQGVPSLNDTEDCVYRNPDGLKCAIGCLIPDAAYRKRLEGESVNYLPASYKKYWGGHIFLASQLQHCHDWTPPKGWRAELRRVAKQFRLNTKVLNQVKK